MKFFDKLIGRSKNKSNKRSDESAETLDDSPSALNAEKLIKRRNKKRSDVMRELFPEDYKG